MRGEQKIGWHVAMMLIALLAGTLLADDKTTTDRLPAFDRELNEIGFRIVSSDTDGDGSADIQQVYSDRNEDDQLEQIRRVSPTIGTEYLQAVTEKQTSQVEPDDDEQSPAIGDASELAAAKWYKTDLRKQIATLEGRVVDRRERETAFGKHLVLRVAGAEDEIVVDCGQMELPKDQLAVGEKVVARGLTSLGISDEGMLAFSVATAADQDDRSSDKAVRKSIIVEGEVVDVLVGPVGDTKAMRVVVETKDRIRTFVSLGAKESLTKMPKQGELLKAVGVGGAINGKSHLVAHRYQIANP